MAVPRNRHSNARRNSKRSHHAKKAAGTILCTNCKAEKRPHVLCACGYYAGRQVVAVSNE